jgi:hypothetical protein
MEGFGSGMWSFDGDSKLIGAFEPLSKRLKASSS